MQCALHNINVEPGPYRARWRQLRWRLRVLTGYTATGQGSHCTLHTRVGAQLLLTAKEWHTAHCTVHCPLHCTFHCTAHCTLHTAHCTLHTALHCAPPSCTIGCYVICALSGTALHCTALHTRGAYSSPRRRISTPAAHCTLRTALIQFATAALEHYLPVLS
jgi:hypothetical protein